MEITRWPKGGLNVDDSVEIIDPDDWIYAANIVDGKSYNGKSGEKENIMGTTLLVSTDWTDANSRLIGVIRSAEDDINYLFFYNSTATKHCILKLQGETVSLVVKGSGLNFQNSKAYRINGGGVVGELLYFTDNFNEPRCVHITDYAGGLSPFEERILHIKRGPQFAPEIDEASFVGTDNKPIDDVQFACQYEYKDGQLSVVSPWTKLVRGFGMDGVDGALDEVSLRLNATETIPYFARKLKMIARKGNDGTPFYWFEVTTEDTVLDPFEQVNYDYLYTEQNLGTVPSDYLKNADLVPLTAKASCVTKSRAWFANYTEGYDTPTEDVTLTFALENTASLNDEGPTFGPNARYKLGVVFHDDQGRSCGVMTQQDWELETDLEMGVLAARQHLKYRIAGTPPDWASSYSLVMTKDMNKTYFINHGGISDTGSEIYVEVDIDENETYSTTYSSSATYLRLNMSGMNNRGIYYSFRDGDYVYVTETSTGDTYGPLRIRRIDGVYLYVDVVDVGAIFEYAFQIFTPNPTSEQFYYEIDRRLVVAGGLDTTDYYTYGDCIAVSVLGGGLPACMAQMRYKPNDGPWDLDIGKPFIKTDIGQVHKKTFVRFSSPFIEGTNVNGLSEFNSGDEGNVPGEAVAVQKLVPTMKESSDGDVLLAICNSNTYSIYMGESRMSTNEGSFLIASPEIIGDIRKQRSGLGTLHPESTHEEDGYVYFYDHLSRSFCRYASNGIFPISEYKVVDYFEDQAVLNSSSDEVVVGYDPFYKMVFVTFDQADTAVKKTIAWSAKKERWISFFNFAPDRYITGSKNLYSVVNGSIYIHNNDAADGFNNFYGSDFDSVIDLSFNDHPDVPKECRVIQLNLSNNFYSFSDADQVIATDALRVDISNRHGQETSILYNEFGVDENLVYGEIRGDENSTGGVLEGDPIYSNTVQARITFAAGSYKQILMVKVGFEPSRGHTL